MIKYWVGAVTDDVCGRSTLGRSVVVVLAMAVDELDDVTLPGLITFEYLMRGWAVFFRIGSVVDAAVELEAGGVVMSAGNFDFSTT